MSVTPESLMHAVAEVARLASEAALAHFGSGLAVETKADGSPVTAADRDAERVARAWIEARFAGDGILGEELGLARPAARRRWIIDPIDGTRSFTAGVPLWGTLVAVVEGDTVLAGAASYPAVGESIAAAPGEGAWWNGSRCHVSSTADLGRAVVLATDERFPGSPARGVAWRSLAARAATSRTWGDCYGYLLVATGRAEVMVDAALNPWDSAPLHPIIEEAGGVFTDWRGRRTAFGRDGIATNRALAGAVRALLCGPDRAEADAATGAVGTDPSRDAAPRTLPPEDR